MHIFVIGLNYKSTPLELREQLSFTSSTFCAFLNQLDRPQLHSNLAPKSSHTLESVVVSTCNRLEYYTLTPKPEPAREEIINRLGRAFEIPSSVFRPHLYSLQDEAAIDHLMRVAAGLESMVLGESQILGQIAHTYQSALAHNTAGPILSRLFEMAIHAGKRARTETMIGHNPASVSSIAIRLAQQQLGNLADRVVMILGVGEMGSLATKTLSKQGVKKLLIVNRTKERADQEAAQWNATALTFDQLELGLSQADLVISSTAAPHPVLHTYQVARAMETRSERPLLIIDIALPRDVEENVGKLPGVHLHNIDQLQSQLADNLKDRQREIPKVEAIITQEIEVFMNWYCSLDVVPTITSFRQQFEMIRQQELERALNRLQGLDEREQKIVAELSHRLLNKFLHKPTARLRQEATRGNGIMYTTALHELFALDTDQT
jgi:glutamyl-tRNA reductase